MRGFLLRFLPSLQLPHANGVWCINSRVLMNAIPKREHELIAAELGGIWNQPTKEQALIELAAFKGKYRERYPEAVRSVCEDEEHLLTFYAFPRRCIGIFAVPMRLKAFFAMCDDAPITLIPCTLETSCLSIV